MSSIDKQQFEFEQFVKKKLGFKEDQIVSAELLFCGVGIPLLYEFHLLQAGKSLEKPVLGEDVFGKIDSDAISKKCFDHFLQLLGTCLAHLSAVALPDDGIYLCGSILTAVLPHIMKDIQVPSKSILIKSFTNSKAIGSYLETIPIFFTPEIDLGLKGCWSFLQMIKQ